MKKCCEKAYNKGHLDGEAKQAILENHGRDRFLIGIDAAIIKVVGVETFRKIKRAWRNQNDE